MLKRHLFTTFAALVALIGSATTTNIAYADPSAPASQAPDAHAHETKCIGRK